MFLSRRYRFLPGVLTITTLGVLYAQSTESASRNGAGSLLEPIRVRGEIIISGDGYAVDFSQSATKTKTPLIETPQTVDVVTRQQIEDQGAQTVNAALEYTLGVFAGLAGASSRQTAVAIRGFPGGDPGFRPDGPGVQSDRARCTGQPAARREDPATAIIS